MKAEVISTNEKNFIIDALGSSQRLDGRRPYDMRNVYISFGESIIATIGKYRIKMFNVEINFDF